MKRIVITTFGSLGDLFPYIAIAKQLKARDFSVAIATTNEHQPFVQKHGIEFLPVGIDIAHLLEQEPELMKKVMHRRTGSEYVLRHIVMENLRRSYDDLINAIDGVDLLVTHTISYATILAARMRKIPFVSTILSPVNFWSKYDPPAMPGATWLPAVRDAVGIAAAGWIMNRMKAHIYPWGEEYRKLQAELGLDIDRRNVFFEGQFSPIKTLGLFSPAFGPPQPDWPPNAVATGFPFLDDDPIDEDTRRRLDDFLQAGDPPVVFTLGSSAIFDPGEFYIHSVKALNQLNMRGVLLVGSTMDKNLPTNCPTDLPPSVLALEYLPHALIFPRAAAVVHQGGVGTTAQALRAGVPQLVVAYSHDQFDNAHRIRRLGCGLSTDRDAYTLRSAASLLGQLHSSQYKSAAAGIAEKIQAEAGAFTAAAEIASIAAGEIASTI